MSLSSSSRSTLFPPPSVFVDRFTPWIEINAACFKANVTTIRSLITPGVKLGAMTKGNAYGLGFEKYILMSHAHVDIFYVNSTTDALKIRELEKLYNLPSKRTILHDFDEVSEIIECVTADVEMVIDNPMQHALFLSVEIAAITTPIKVHIFIDSGLNREGFRLKNDELSTALDEIATYQDRLDIKGIMTHFRAGDNAEHTQEQIHTFNQGHALIKQKLALPHTLERSIANSSAALSFPTIEQDIVRSGYALIHGLWPSNNTKSNAAANFAPLQVTLHPVLSWKCKVKKITKCGAGVELVKETACGVSVTLKKPTTIAILACGIVDGFPIYLGNTENGPYVLIKGQKCKVLLVELDEMVVDVTDIETSTEMIATLIGRDGDEFLSAETVASWAKAKDAYGLLTQIKSELPRLLVHSEPVVEEKKQQSREQTLGFK